MTGSGFGGVGEHGVRLDLQCGCERSERLAQLVAGDAIGLGGDHEEWPLVVPEPIEELDVELLWRNGGVY